MIEVSQSKLTEVFGKLYTWLGSFWSKVYTDPDFIKHIQYGRSLELAQLYLDFLENLKLVDRNNAPVFHRERWYPLVIRKSEKNTGSLSTLKLGPNHAYLGNDAPESDTGIYPDTPDLFKLGTATEFEGLETYPVHGHFDDVVTCIVDNIINPKVVLRKGVDFVVSGDSLAVTAANSPFAPSSPFPKFDMIDTGDPDTIPSDQETVLWACDTLVDVDFVNNYLGYVTQVGVDSSELGKNIVNAYWDVLNYANPECLSILVATLCKVPYVKEDNEVVEEVLEDAVITDKNTYRFVYSPVFRKKTVPGQVFKRGEYLDEAIKILPFVTNVAAVDAYLAQTDNFTVEATLPQVTIPGSICDSGSTITLDWTAMTKTAFEAQYGISLPESAPSDIIPAKYFLENVVGANSLFVVLDGSKIVEAPVFQTKYFQLIRESIPAYIRLVISVDSQVADSLSLASDNTGSLLESGILSANQTQAESYTLANNVTEAWASRFVAPCSNL